jgi:hypothetical protein
MGYNDQTLETPYDEAPVTQLSLTILILFSSFGRVQVQCVEPHPYHVSLSPCEKSNVILSQMYSCMYICTSNHMTCKFTY